MCVEQFHYLGEVGQRSAQAVDLIDHHDFDEPLTDVVQGALQRRALHGRAREPAVIVRVLYQTPALARRALDERLTRLTLGVQRIEVLLQSLLGRFARSEDLRV